MVSEQIGGLAERLGLPSHPSLSECLDPPIIRTVNGIGSRLLGAADGPSGVRLKMLWFCVFFLPVLPLAVYEVVPAKEGGWYFIGKMSLVDFVRRKGLAIMPFVLLCVIESVGFGLLFFSLMCAVYVSVAWLFGRL